jgi:hypothetical protein
MKAASIFTRSVRELQERVKSNFTTAFMRPKSGLYPDDIPDSLAYAERVRRTDPMRYALSANDSAAKLNDSTLVVNLWADREESGRYTAEVRKGRTHIRRTVRRTAKA